uniref:Uncharacterized protein n=1 Tax=Arion vulgaris TaxID=1028688 RepID=A0A0B6Z0C0_9EUPU
MNSQKTTRDKPMNSPKTAAREIYEFSQNCKRHTYEFLQNCKTLAAYGNTDPKRNMKQTCIYCFLNK